MLWVELAEKYQGLWLVFCFWCVRRQLIVMHILFFFILCCFFHTFMSAGFADVIFFLFVQSFFLYFYFFKLSFSLSLWAMDLLMWFFLFVHSNFFIFLFYFIFFCFSWQWTCCASNPAAIRFIIYFSLHLFPLFLKTPIFVLSFVFSSSISFSKWQQTQELKRCPLYRIKIYRAAAPFPPPPNASAQ